MKISEEKKAYIAGFFDGEGCASFHRVGKSGYNENGRDACYSVICCLTNNNIEPLNFIKNIFGGSIYESNRNGNPKHSISYVLKFTSRTGAYVFLKSIKDYLIVKKDQVEVIIEYLESRLGKVSKRGQNYQITDDEFSMIRNVRLINSKNNKRVSLI